MIQSFLPVNFTFDDIDTQILYTIVTSSGIGIDILADQIHDSHGIPLQEATYRVRLLIRNGFVRVSGGLLQPAKSLTVDANNTIHFGGKI